MEEGLSSRDPDNENGWQYRAFFSYSRNDDRVANWLHKSLERYVVPKDLRNRDDVISNAKNWFVPIFRDRTDLNSGGDLAEKLRSALQSSQYLILLCSPASANSPIVDAEVQEFVNAGRVDQIFPVIVSGEPYSSNPETECIPPSLRSHNLVAADMRDFELENGKRVGDGKDGAKFKLIAGMLGVPLDKLLQRERKKANRRVAFQSALSMVFLALSVVAAGAAWMAYLSEQEAQRQRATAEASSDFLIDMFQSGIPNRQNPNHVTARTILDRGARQMDQQFEDQPEIKAVLSSMIANAYYDLGAVQDGITLIEKNSAELDQAGLEGIRARILLARLHLRAFDHAEAAEIVEGVISELGGLRDRQYELEGYAWETMGSISQDLGDAKAAIDSFDKSIAAYASIVPPQPALAAPPIAHKAVLLSDLGEFDQAVEGLNKAKQLYEEQRGADSLSVARTNYSLALNGYNSGSYDEGLQYLADALESFERLLEPGNPIFGDVYTLKGELEFEVGDIPAAKQSLETAIEIYQEAYGTSSADMGFTYYYLALVGIEQSDYIKALEFAELAEEMFKLRKNPNIFNLASLQILQAEALSKSGQQTKATQVCQAALKTLSDLPNLSAENYSYFANDCAALEKSPTNNDGVAK